MSDHDPYSDFSKICGQLQFVNRKLIPDRLIIAVQVGLCNTSKVC